MDNNNNANNTATVKSATNPDIEKNRNMAIIAYIFFLIPLLSVKDSSFTTYHINQGLWLFIFGSIANLLAWGILWFLGPFVSVAWIIYIILGITNVNNNEMKPLPGFENLPVLIK